MVEGVEVVATLPRETALTAPLPIKIQVNNHREKPITLRARPGKISFVVRMYDSTGAEVPGREGSPMHLRENLLHGLTDAATPPIAPGGTYEQAHDLNKLYVLKTAGVYRVAVYSRGNLGARTVPLEIVDLSVTIFPPD